MSANRKRACSDTEPECEPNTRERRHEISDTAEATSSKQQTTPLDPHKLDSAATIAITQPPGPPADEVKEPAAEKEGNPAQAQTERGELPHVTMTKNVGSSASIHQPSADRSERKRWHNNVFDVDSNTDGLRDILDEHLNHLVRIAFPLKCPWQLLDSDTKAKLTAVCPEADRCLAGEYLNGSQNLLHAWLWHMVYDNLFSPECTDKWTGSWAFFGALQRSLRGGVNNTDDPYTMAYHTARSLLVRMLYMRHGPHTYSDRLVLILRAAIAPIIKLRAHPDCQSEINDDYNEEEEEEGNEEEARRQRSQAVERMLVGIAEEAIRIDFFMLASRRSIIMHMGDPVTGARSGFHFSPSIMTSIGGYLGRRDGESGYPPVDYVQSPLIQVFGDTYPSYEVDPIFQQHVSPLIREYDTCMWKRQMVVVFNSEVPYVDREPGDEDSES